MEDQLIEVVVAMLGIGVTTFKTGSLTQLCVELVVMGHDETFTGCDTDLYSRGGDSITSASGEVIIIFMEEGTFTPCPPDEAVMEEPGATVEDSTITLLPSEPETSDPETCEEDSDPSSGDPTILFLGSLISKGSITLFMVIPMSVIDDIPSSDFRRPDWL